MFPRRFKSAMLALGLLGGAALASCGGTNNGGSGFAGGDGGTGDSSFNHDSGPILGSDGSLGNDAPATDSGGPGPMPCDSSCMAAGGTCQNGNTCVIAENPGGVDPGTQQMLVGGGMADSQFGWLYPYDKTVFPRGLIPPTMQFGGAAPDAAYVHVSFTGLDYKGFYGSSSPGRIVFSGPVWTAITVAAGALADVKVDVTKISSGMVTGPITEHWTIAQGSLRGTIYYETYGSPLATAAAGGNPASGGVGIMQIQPGALMPKVIQAGCGNVCHTASADGSTLVANSGGPFNFTSSSTSYDLRNNAAVIFNAPDLRFTYGALYPDGSFGMAATNFRTWAPGFGGVSSSLYDSHTGAKISAPGWDGVVNNAGCAAFSPDGKHFAFNHEDSGQGHTLAAMDFDVTTKTFSNLADIANDPANTLAWPAFTPDGKWVVYHSGSNNAFETDNGATGDVYIVDLASHTTHRLDALDGYTGSGSATYLPANDPNLSFAPTVLPEAVGGYFWAVFTSHRSYGNTTPSMDNMDQNGKLWVAAIDLSPTAGQDASHPAFYLDGQEVAADNLRGFWVLSPCKGDGQSCTSGDECCGGYCSGNPSMCGSTSQGCSQVYDKCTTAADCCDPNDQCINNRCALPPPK